MNILFYKSQLQVPVYNKFVLCAKVISCRKITDDVLKFKSALKAVFLSTKYSEQFFSMLNYIWGHIIVHNLEAI